MQSFLAIIEKTFGGSDYIGAQHGGVAGHDGSGLPTGTPNNFMFATGIECSAPTIDNGRIRRDLLAECGHYDRWREDLHLVRDLGLRVLRYGLPLHRIFLGPNRYDWAFADLAMEEMRALGITPILDLCHFGLPDWLGDFQNPEFPVHFAAYCGAVAERYPWVRFYTPVNEIYVTAKFSAREGLWNEQLNSDRAFVTAIKHCAAANILGIHAIAGRRPDCVIVQSESAEIYHELRALRSNRVSLVNKQRFIALDLLYATPPDAEIMLYLLDNGMTRHEYDWFMRGEPPGYHIMGNDYYGRNEHIITPDGRPVVGEPIVEVAMALEALPPFVTLSSTALKISQREQRHHVVEGRLGDGLQLWDRQPKARHGDALHPPLDARRG